MTSRPAAPSRRPRLIAPRGGPALPLASAGRSCHIILLLFSPYLELLSRQFRPRGRPPRLSVCGIRRSRALFWLCVCLGCVLGGLSGRGEESRAEGKEGSRRATRSRAALSCLCAPRRWRRRRALLGEDAALELGAARTPLRREASCARWSYDARAADLHLLSLEFPPRPWEGLAAAAAAAVADGTAGSPLRGGASKRPRRAPALTLRRSCGPQPPPRCLPPSSSPGAPPLGSDPRAPDAGAASARPPHCARR